MAATAAFKKAERDYGIDLFGIEQCQGIVRIPEQQSGRWKIQNTLDVPQEFIYQQLWYDDALIMDNHPQTLSLMRPFVQKAQGNVLINGLGLGVSLAEILKKETVLSVKVIESSQDVIRLVGQTFNDKRVTIILADAFAYELRADEYYQAVWHAIWSKKEQVREEEKQRLSRKYRHHCKWQGFLFDEMVF